MKTSQEQLLGIASPVLVEILKARASKERDLNPSTPSITCAHCGGGPAKEGFFFCDTDCRDQYVKHYSAHMEGMS